MAPTYLILSKMRYMHSLMFPKTSAYWNPDAMAGQLLPWHERLEACILGTVFRLFPFMRLIYTKWRRTSRPGGMTARTRFLDESIRSAVADGAKQLVILGAGLDTRPGRMRDILEGVRVFEVDLPDSQAVKRAALQRAGMADDWGAEFVPVDFRDANWQETLREAGCNLEDVRTHVLWEGVIYYLTEEGIAATTRSGSRVFRSASTW